MASTRRDLSGVFDAELRGQKAVKAAVLEQSFRLDPKGITFVSDQVLTQWAEVGVEMQLPRAAGAEAGRAISCRAVVVHCARRGVGRGYEVALWFLDLPKHAQRKLGFLPETLSPLSISITR